MPEDDQKLEPKVTCCEVEQPVPFAGNAGKLQLVPAPRRPARRKRDLGARLKAILVARFLARGLSRKEAQIQAQLCLGLVSEDEADRRSLRREIVAIR